VRRTFVDGHERGGWAATITRRPAVAGQIRCQEKPRRSRRTRRRTKSVVGRGKP
jgi:hypothetical protein